MIKGLLNNITTQNIYIIWKINVSLAKLKFRWKLKLRCDIYKAIFLGAASSRRWLGLLWRGDNRQAVHNYGNSLCVSFIHLFDWFFKTLFACLFLNHCHLLCEFLYILNGSSTSNFNLIISYMFLFWSWQLIFYEFHFYLKSGFINLGT